MSGARVVVTRPPAQAAALCKALRELGAVALEVPLIEVEQMSTAPALDAHFDVLIYVSRNAVLHGLTQGSPTPLVVALGPATAAALADAGLRADIVAEPAGGSEGLLAHDALSDAALRGKRVLIVKGQGGRKLLRETFEARGAQVTERDVYRRMPAADAAEALSRCFAEGHVDAVVLTSVEIAEAWLDKVPSSSLSEVLSDTLHVVISGRIAAALHAAGARRTVVAPSTHAATLAATAIRA